MTAYQAMDDEQLVRLIVAGNHDAFAELVTRHIDTFFGFAYRTLRNQSDAEEVVQICFIKFWERPNIWKPGKAKFTTWFYRVILNACHDHLRRGARTTYLEPDLLETELDDTMSEQVGLDQRQQERLRQQYLMEGMRQLPSSQRDALNLVVYCELNQKQAAEILGVSVKALESLLVRAKRALAQTIAALQSQQLREEMSNVK